MRAMGYFEFFYKEQLKKKKKSIEAFKSNYPEVPLYAKKDIKTLYSLNQARKKMREANERTLMVACAASSSLVDGLAAAGMWPPTKRLGARMVSALYAQLRTFQTRTEVAERRTHGVWRLACVPAGRPA